MASLDDLIATCSPRFKPRAIYIEAADCLQVYIHPGATVRRRVDDIMTFYEDPESKKLTGCMVKGVKRLVQELGGFGIDVFDADGLRIKMVFWAYTLAKKDEGIPEPDQPLFRELLGDYAAAATRSSLSCTTHPCKTVGSPPPTIGELLASSMPGGVLPCVRFWQQAERGLAQRLHQLGHLTALRAQGIHGIQHFHDLRQYLGRIGNRDRRGQEVVLVESVAALLRRAGGLPLDDVQKLRAVLELQRFSDDTTILQLASPGPERTVAASEVVQAERAKPYRTFYQALATLREEFHRVGRFDDANAKLEEVCKLLAVAALERRHPKKASRLSVDSLADVARRKFGSPTRLASALRLVYDDFVRHFSEELSSFGGKPALSMAEDDDEFAAAVLPLLSSLPAEPEGQWSFDGLNEAFGHFVQASFRNRKEDAQYMTPPEVVTPLVRLAIEDVARDLARELGPRRPLRIADPTCGVGSFLAAAYRTSFGVQIPAGELSDYLVLLGQDKVDRMVRMANANLRIFARTSAEIRAGNSVLPVAGLEDWSGTVDLILTNPPFGAEFETEQVLAHSAASDYPTLHALASRRKTPRVVGSEYLLVDRGVSLLRPGGRMLIVVPDHVVSGSGFSEDFRACLRETTDLVAVFDLPAETFAQAGTRTRTSVLYLRRRAAPQSNGKNFVVMATANDLGFRVKSRTGATVKEIVGTNELEAIVQVVRTFRQKGRPTAEIACLSEQPSVAAVVDTEVQADHWNAGFFRPRRLHALQRLRALESRGMEIQGLGDLAQVDPPASGRATAENGFTCISVLHVREDGVIDMDAALRYRPTTPCVPCKSGDVLMSRINPHIVRVCIVPESAGRHFACSAEFAILRPKKETGLNSAALALLLRSEVVQAQVQTLTSGTSSSHSRVKPRELRMVRVAVPRQRSKEKARLDSAATAYHEAVLHLYQAVASMAASDKSVSELLGG